MKKSTAIGLIVIFLILFCVLLVFQSQHYAKPEVQEHRQFMKWSYGFFWKKIPLTKCYKHWRHQDLMEFNEGDNITAKEKEALEIYRNLDKRRLELRRMIEMYVPMKFAFLESDLEFLETQLMMFFKNEYPMEMPQKEGDL